MIGNAAGGYQKDIDVFIQSNTSSLFQAFLQTYEKEDILLTSDISIGDLQINISSGHGASIGDSLIIYTDTYYWQVEVKAVATNLITLLLPAFLPFSVADTTIIRGNTNMNGATFPVEYKFGIPGIGQAPVDITSALVIMGHATQGDDGDFGDQSALTNGLLLRKEDGSIFNFGVYRTNRDFRLNNAAIDYSDKGPAGTFGTNIKFFIQGQEHFDQVIRLKYGEFIKAIRQDALNGLNFLRISLIGSYTTGE